MDLDVQKISRAERYVGGFRFFEKKNFGIGLAEFGVFRVYLCQCLIDWSFAWSGSLRTQ